MGVQARLETFGEFVDAHQVEILRYLLRLTDNSSDAEDLFQETFLRALSAFPRLRAGSNHRAWLYRIATNVFLNHRRDGQRRQEVALPGELAGHHPSPDAVHDRTVTAHVFRRALARLPRRQRVAFVQRLLNGQSYQEIATALGCTPDTARAHVYQAVRRLRREMATQGVTTS